jgi:hypothetical protein
MGSSPPEKYGVVEQIDPEQAMDAEVVEQIDWAPTAPPTGFAAKAAALLYLLCAFISQRMGLEASTPGLRGHHSVGG